MADFEFSIEQLTAMAAKATTEAQLDEIEALWGEANQAKVLAALGDLRNNSVKMLALVEKMTARVDRLAASVAFSNDATIQSIRDQIGTIHSELHDSEGMKKTIATGDGVVEVVDDEKTVPGSVTPAPLPPAGPTLETPTPINDSSYVSLADEYVRFFNGAGLRPTHASKIDKLAETAIRNRPRYEAVGNPMGIPWWFIAGLHQLESTYNFKTHLHNGDTLQRRTVHVPAGRPLGGTPPFTWEESAADALKLQKLNGLSDWSLPRALWRWERYNGFGYRKKRVPTPYLWSFSTIYLRGKFVGDGVWDGSATSAQCGTAVLLKALVEKGEVTVQTDLATETEPSTPDGPTPALPDAPPNIDDQAVASHPFEAFWRENLSDIQNFTWREFLFKGGAHATNGLNTDPPRQFWENVIPLARALDALRNRLGKPISLSSIYRSPAYNAALDGSATRSHHMAFRAADFKVVGAGAGSPGDWAAAAAQLRSDGVFEGGIGIYNTFVHIDTRGTRADWDQR